MALTKDEVSDLKNLQENLVRRALECKDADLNLHNAQMAMERFLHKLEHPEKTA